MPNLSLSTPHFCSVTTPVVPEHCFFIWTNPIFFCKFCTRSLAQALTLAVSSSHPRFPGPVTWDVPFPLHDHHIQKNKKKFVTWVHHGGNAHTAAGAAAPAAAAAGRTARGGRWSMRRRSGGAAARRASRARPPSCSTRARTAAGPSPTRSGAELHAALHTRTCAVDAVPRAPPARVRAGRPRRWRTSCRRFSPRTTCSTSTCGARNASCGRSWTARSWP